jgi:hypothetical protein
MKFMVLGLCVLDRKNGVTIDFQHFMSYFSAHEGVFPCQEWPI